MSTTKSAELEKVHEFFKERIETVTAENGTVVYVQRPKEVEEGAATAAVSADDLPDDFDVNTVISANSAKLYRIAAGPVLAVINYVPESLSVDIAAKAKVPIVGEVTIAKAKGNLKQGVELHLKYSSLISGDIGVKLNQNTAVLHWNITAFGKGPLEDKMQLFSI